VEGEVRFAADLYSGTAGDYDRYRLPYPEAMIEDLVRVARVSGRGRLLDLACGTGQLAFPLRPWFAEVWAVDQEPDMVEVVRAKAAAAGARGFRPVVSSAETLRAGPEYFELAVIGNAFHRLDRDLVASRILGWLQPGGHLALCWSSAPWAGKKDWQRALAAALDWWKAALGAETPGDPSRRPPGRPGTGDCGGRAGQRPGTGADPRPGARTWSAGCTGPGPTRRWATRTGRP
jgi:SAM-dependent methyltransferase